MTRRDLILIVVLLLCASFSFILFENDFQKLLEELTPSESYLDVFKEAIKIAHKTEYSSIASLEREILTLIEKEKAARTKRAKKENERENGIKAMLIGAFIAGGSFIIELFSYASAHVQAVSDAGLNGVGTASYTVAFIPGIFLGVIIFIAGLFTWLLNRF